MKATTFGLAAYLALGLVGACQASDMVAAENVSGTTVGFVLTGSHSNATLSVSGPNGFHASSFSRGGAVAIDLSESGAVQDGPYNYQLTAASGETVSLKSSLDNGRGDAGAKYAYRPAAKSGTFNVKGGKIVGYGASVGRGKRDLDAR